MAFQTIFQRYELKYMLTENQKEEINLIAEEMQSKESEFLVYKKNAGKKQENIKFPIEYRNRINKLFFEVLGIEEDVNILNKVHSSSLFEESEGDEVE